MSSVDNSEHLQCHKNHRTGAYIAAGTTKRPSGRYCAWQLRGRRLRRWWWVAAIEVRRIDLKECSIGSGEGWIQSFFRICVIFALLFAYILVSFISPRLQKGSKRAFRYDSKQGTRKLKTRDMRNGDIFWSMTLTCVIHQFFCNHLSIKYQFLTLWKRIFVHIFL